MINMALPKSFQDKAVQFLQGAIQAESITGNESNFVAYLNPKMQALDLNPQAEEFAKGRLNIWGQTACGAGKKLLVVGHTDTVHVEGWAEKWNGSERQSPFCGAIVDGQVWGRGSGDLKAGICAWLMAWDLLKSKGVNLNGGLQFAFIGDEESGQADMGTSEGIKHYVSKIAPKLPKPDFAVYTEPSQNNVYSVQMGFFIADIEITGKTAYFGVPEKGIDALKAAHNVLGSILEHSEEIGKDHNHDLVGKPFALVTELSAGGYIAVPGEAKISLIRKLTPTENMDIAISELEKVVHNALKKTGCEVTFSYPAGRDHKFGGLSSETPKDLPEIEILSTCIKKNWPSTGDVCAAPFWSEKSFIKEFVGCDAVYCAPGDISNCHTLEERVDIKEYLAAIQSFAEFIAKYCGVKS